MEGNEREGQTFNVARLRQLLPHQIRKLVNRLVCTNRVVFWEDALDVIEAVADADVLNHVARVQDVRPGWRNLDLDARLIRRSALHDEAHLLSALSHLFRIEGQAEDAVDVLHLHIEVGVVHRWGHLTLALLSLIRDFHLLNFVAPIALAMVTKLRGKHGQADLGLLNVGTCDLDENVAGVEGDFGRLGVDDRRQREHLPVLVVEYGVLIEGFQDGEELLHLDVASEDVEEGVGVHGFALLQGLENNLVRRERLVGDWAAELVHIMGAHRG